MDMLMITKVGRMDGVECEWLENLTFRHCHMSIHQQADMQYRAGTSLEQISINTHTLEQRVIALGLATESCSTSTKACQELQHELGSPALRTYDGTANFGPVFCSAPRPSQIDSLRRPVQNPAAHSVRPVDRDDTIVSIPRSFETCMHGSTGQTCMEQAPAHHWEMFQDCHLPWRYEQGYHHSCQVKHRSRIKTIYYTGDK